MNSDNTTDSEFLYDAQLTAIDHPNKALIFSVVRSTHRVPVSDTSYWHIGEVGRLRLPGAGCAFAFHRYSDPLMRRAPGLDDSTRNLWGWRLGERRFAVKAGILPGIAGAVVACDTQPLMIQLPLEFRNLCTDAELRPESVLRGFIADLCSLMNLCACPREDEYSSNGSDERRLAKDYFRRAYGWAFYREEGDCG